MRHIKVGVIGVGRMGQNHCRIYASLRQVEFAGVYDIDPQAAQKVAQRYEVSAFRSVDDLLDAVEAVSITTPTQSHFDLTMACLRRGIHVLVEKPFTETLEQAETIIKAAETRDSVIQVGYIERFNPVYVELKNVIENIPALALNFRRLSPYKGSNTDVDVVLDLMTHDLDLVLDLIPEQPSRITATGLRVFGDVLDHAVVQITYPNPLIATLTASRITEQKIRCVEATARDAYVEADLLNKTIQVHRRTTGEYLNQNLSGVKYRHESLVERILVPNIEPLVSEIQHFITCIVEHETPRVTAWDGFKALRMAFLIRGRIAEGEASLEKDLAFS